MDFTSSTSRNNFFSGLDYDIIDFIYFKDETEKLKFISEIEALLIKLEINDKTDNRTGRKKIEDYINETEEPIPFIMDILCYDIIETTTLATSKTVYTKREAPSKLDNYFITLKLCCHNLEKKTENNVDFKFEVDLINKTLKETGLFNFPRINTLYNLGVAYKKANQTESMESIFNKIRKENYALSSFTIADHYRYIGEVYIELKQNEKALDWLNASLRLIPNLDVKKLIDNLEKK